MGKDDSPKWFYWLSYLSSFTYRLDFSRNFSHCNASLKVNDSLAMSGDQPTWLSRLSDAQKASSSPLLSSWLHLGGAPQAPFGLISDLPAGSGFTGCLHSLQTNGRRKEIFGWANFTLLGLLPKQNSRNTENVQKLNYRTVPDLFSWGESWKTITTVFMIYGFYGWIAFSSSFFSVIFEYKQYILFIKYLL